MAISNQGVRVSIPAGQIDATFTNPEPATVFTDHEYSRTFDLTVTRSTMATTADPATTLEAIVVEVSDQIDAIMGADFDDTALTITYWIDLIKVSTNQTPETTASGFLTNATVVYEMKATVYIKTA